jgi:hypothetical protein
MPYVRPDWSLGASRLSPACPVTPPLTACPVTPPLTACPPLACRSEFVFVNPNAKGSCGCGESFTTK